MFLFLSGVASQSLYHDFEEKSFVGWMREHNNFFTGEEYQVRFGIWLSNKRMVQQHNAAESSSFTLCMNHLSHLTPSEYRSILGFKVNMNKNNAIKSNFVPNDACDWRDKGCVNEVKNQAQCGSCWAFSAIQAQESQWAKSTGKLLSLSEQNLVDCCTEEYNCAGCNGGLMDGAYQYVIDKQAGKFMLESDYPYTAKDGKCKFDATKGVTNIVKFTNIVEGDEADLASKVAQLGVAAIAIDASHFSFQMYSHGVYDEKRCSPSDLDHGVGCVGYGTEGSVNYWIVRNSWGKSWGEKGYIRMIKDKGNQCGEASMACIPIDA